MQQQSCVVSTLTINTQDASWQNQQTDVRPVKTQIGLGIRPVWSIFAVRSMGS